MQLNQTQHKNSQREFKFEVQRHSPVTPLATVLTGGVRRTQCGNISYIIDANFFTVRALPRSTLFITSISMVVE